MSLLMKQLRMAFSIPPSSKKVNDSYQANSIIRRVVKQTASGNCSLQRGKYCTQDAIDSRRGKICGHVFFAKS